MAGEALRTDFEVPPELYEVELEALIEEANIDEDLRESVRMARQFSQELPYHHGGHNLGTMRRVLIEARERELSHYETQVLVLAAAWHDAAYGLPLGDEFESREHRSANLAKEAIMGTCSIERFEETYLLATRVATVIMGTNSKSETTDSLAEILNIADLANLYDDDVITMLRETGAYFMEELMLGGVDVKGQTLADIGKHRDLLALWIDGARNHVESLVRSKLDAGDERTRIALDHIGQLTVGRVLEALSSRSNGSESSS